MTRHAHAATYGRRPAPRLFGAWAALGCAFLCLACGRQPLDRADAAPALPWAAVRAGDQSGLSRGALALAGGLDALYHIEWSTFPSGPPLLEAIAADAVDLGPVGDSPPIFAQAAGAKIRIVAVTRNSPRYEVLLAPAGSPLRTVADLRGKRVAVAKGSGAHHLLLAALLRAGLSTADIRAVYLSPTDAQPAFASGDVDAWAAWDPYAANNLRAGRSLPTSSSPPDSFLPVSTCESYSIGDSTPFCIDRDPEAWALRVPAHWLPPGYAVGR